MKPSSATVAKSIRRVHRAPAPHWVGNGFHVNSLFFYDQDAQALSPFLLLDYAAPRTFAPSSQPRGVGVHPHRGFETVTVAYQGEIEHRDSEGNRGVIGTGDVQWMTAASGIVHEEWLSSAFNARGGTLEMAQLWVNLPAQAKRAPPRYQALTQAQIPVVRNDGVTVRVIAGAYPDAAGETLAHGPAQTFSPVDVWDMRIEPDRRLDLALRDGYTTILALLKGSLRVHGDTHVNAPAAILFEREGSAVAIEAGAEGASVLALHGEPLNEPVAGHGPFVMNTREELVEAFTDYQRGTFVRSRAGQG